MKQVAVKQNKTAAAVKSERLVSLDVLRGFDMFWIIGGCGLFISLVNYLGIEWLMPLKTQMHHVDWHGFSLHDLIFPLFVFIAGISMQFSIAKKLRQGASRKAIYFKAIRRGLTLVLLGVIYNGLLKFDFDNLRIPSVIGLIGLSYIWGSLIVLSFKPLHQALIAAGILVGYYILMVFIPVPGFGAGVLTPEGNWASYIDRMIMPGFLLTDVTDPEGLIMTFQASVLVVMGSFVGMLIRTKSYGSYKKVGILLLAGAALIVCSLIWSRFFPYNKKLWTSSFVLLAGGLSVILFALFYMVVDIWKIRKLFFPFVLIGMNPITIYFAAGRVVNFRHISNFFFGGIASHVSEPLSPVVQACGLLIVEILFLYFLYRKKIFLRV